MSAPVDDVEPIHPLESEQIRRLVELVQWLSLTYGGNLPIFHGERKAELEETYRWALPRENTDPAFFAAVELSQARPEPAPYDPALHDWSDRPVEYVTIDGMGNTILTTPDVVTRQVAKIDRRSRRWWQLWK